MNENDFPHCDHIDFLPLRFHLKYNTPTETESRKQKLRTMGWRNMKKICRIVAHTYSLFAHQLPM